MPAYSPFKNVALLCFALYLFLYSQFLHPERVIFLRNATIEKLTDLKDAKYKTCFQITCGTYQRKFAAENEAILDEWITLLDAYSFCRSSSPYRFCVTNLFRSSKKHYYPNEATFPVRAGNEVKFCIWLLLSALTVVAINPQREFPRDVMS